MRVFLFCLIICLLLLELANSIMFIHKNINFEVSYQLRATVSGLEIFTGVNLLGSLTLENLLFNL